MKLLSPPGLAGIAILRVEARERDDVVAALRTATGKTPQLGPGRPATRAELRLDGHVVDDVLVVCRCDDQLELHVHGSPAVLDQLDQHFGVSVATPVTPAERLLAEALSVEQFALAAEQLRFDFSEELALLKLLAVAERRTAVTEALERSRVARALVEPQRVVLVGRQNAGKSSLFNQLLFRERALTGATPGLTRDAIAEVTTLTGYPYELVDTAGEGVVGSAIDAAAIERSRSWRRGAMLLLVVDGSLGPDADDRQLAVSSSLVVASKLDLVQAAWPADVPRDAEVLAQTGLPEAIRTRLGELLQQRRGLPVSGPVGGFAALDELQLQLLITLEADCYDAHSSA